jgi:hypothetical protein
MPLTEQQKEGLARYKKHYPQNCEGLDDISIMLNRCVISNDQARSLRNEQILPTSNAGGAGRELKPKGSYSKKAREKKIRPYTDKQIAKLCQAAKKDFLGDNPNTDIEDVAFDMAESMISGDERIQAFFEKSGVKRRYWKEALADYFG